MKLNNLQMETMIYQIMKQIEDTLQSEKKTDDFFGNVFQDQRDTKIKRRSMISQCYQTFWEKPQVWPIQFLQKEFAWKKTTIVK